MLCRNKKNAPFCYRLRKGPAVPPALVEACLASGVGVGFADYPEMG